MSLWLWLLWVVSSYYCCFRVFVVFNFVVVSNEKMDNFEWFFSRVDLSRACCLMMHFSREFDVTKGNKTTHHQFWPSIFTTSVLVSSMPLSVVCCLAYLLLYYVTYSFMKPFVIVNKIEHSIYYKYNRSIMASKEQYHCKFRVQVVRLPAVVVVTITTAIVVFVRFVMNKAEIARSVSNSKLSLFCLITKPTVVRTFAW